VGDGAAGAVEDRGVRDERKHSGVRGDVEARRIGRGKRGDDMDLLLGERLERAAHEAAVVLELGGGRHEHYRLMNVVEPAGRIGGRVPVARPHEADVRGPVRARVLEGLGGHIQEQRRGGEHGGRVLERWQSRPLADLVHARENDSQERPQEEGAEGCVSQPTQPAARGRKAGAKRRHVGRRQWEGIWTP
jgi:hypothetical protein